MKHFLLLILLISAIVCNATETLEFSYADSSSNYWGTSKKENFDVAIFLPADQFKDCKITSLKVPMNKDRNGKYEKYGNIKVWVSSELRLEDKVNIPDVSYSATVNEDGLISFEFPESYTIGDKGAYVGYSFDVAELDSGTKYPIAIGNQKNENGLWIHSSRTYLNWSNIAESEGFSSAMVLGLQSDSFLGESVSFVKMPQEVYASRDTKKPVNVKLSSFGSIPVTSVDFDITVNGITTNSHYDLPEPLPLRLGKEFKATVVIPAQSNLMSDEITLTVAKVNGVENKATNKKSTTVRLNVLKFVPEHQALFEEYSGTWCSYCPRGYAVLEHLKKNYPDYIVASYHMDDPMDCMENFPNKVNSIPTAYINRNISCDPYYGTGTYNTQLPIVDEILAINEQYTPWSINVNHTWESDFKLTANVNIMCNEDVEGDFKIAYILISDGLSGEKWGQSNNYESIEQSDSYIPELNNFCKDGIYGYSPVKSLVYDDIVISSDGIMGIEGSIPEYIKAEQLISHSFTFNLSTIKPELIPDKNKLRIIAVVLDNNGKALNCAKNDVSDYPGDSKVTEIEGMTFSTTMLSPNGCLLTKYSGELENLIIPEKVEIDGSEYKVISIGFKAFYHNNIIKSITLPSSIRYIEDYAFANCPILKNINLPEGILKIQSHAFENCTNLNIPKLPSSLQIIGDYAFSNKYGFKRLENIVFPQSLIYIGQDNFNGVNINSIVFEDGETDLVLGKNVLSSSDFYTYLYIGRNLKNANLPKSSRPYGLNIGVHVKDICWFDPSETSNLIQIVSSAVNPPFIGRFTQEQYDNIKVFVPETSMDAYSNDQTWAFFTKLNGLIKPAEEYNFTILSEEMILNVGDKLEILCKTEPAVDSEIDFKISDITVLSISENKVSGLKSGEADVTVTLLLNGKTATCHVTVVQPATDIRINKSNLDLKKGESVRILANISPVDVSDPTVTWASSNPEIATVAEDGTVTAVRGGNCEITATTHNGLTATCQVKVMVMPEAIALDKYESSILVGESLALTATLSPDDVTETELVWTSSDPAIATVEGGEVKGIAPGSAVITATTVNNLSASSTVTVMPILAESITVTPETLELLKGTTSQLNAEVLPVNVTDPSVVWSSGDESVATVAEDGTVTAVGKGECKITATTSNGLTSGCKIIVEVLPESVTLDQSEAEVVIGETINLTATLSPDDVTETELIWTSSDPAIATVEDGEVKGMSLGTAVITATTVNNISASCSVTVLPILVETVTVIPDAIEAVEGTSVQLTAVVLPENASDKTISWNSSNVSVATVDETGLVNILTPGTAVITATANDEGKAVGECQVTGLSTVEWLRTDDNLWDLYAPTGLLLKSAIRINDLNDIAPGIYILRSGSRNIKIRL